MTNKEEAIEYLKWIRPIRPYSLDKIKVQESIDLAIKALEERPQGECKSCIYRDPEDKKCDCGGMERQGCIFPVSDNYYCKYYEKDGADMRGEEE